MKAYFQMAWKRILAGAGIFIFINFYFGVLLRHRILWEDLAYFDAIFFMGGLVCLFLSWYRWAKTCALLHKGTGVRPQEAKRLLGGLITDYLSGLEEENSKEIAALTQEMNELTDYITRWVHEVKLPLASLNLMNERNQDAELQQGMQECLERMQQLLNTMLLSSKLKSLENDVQYRKTMLEEVVRESLKNQSYFLIHEHFRIEMDLGEVFVYSDSRWLVYILDQFIGNAVKYRGSDPVLTFTARQVSKDEAVLVIRDNGTGISREDLPFIFDKGYTGGNIRNGDYRSTGMGLYFVRKTAERLGITVEADSAPREGAEFRLHFCSNAAFFIL